MFILIRFNINQQGQESHSQQTFNSEELALKRFYSILATDIDNDAYQYELVQIIRMSDGITLYNQVFDKRENNLEE